VFLRSGSRTEISAKIYPSFVRLTWTTARIFQQTLITSKKKIENGRFRFFSALQFFQFVSRSLHWMSICVKAFLFTLMRGRVTRLGKYLPIELLLYLRNLSKFSEVCSNFGLFQKEKICNVLFLTKNGSGDMSGDVLKSSSSHPDPRIGAQLWASLCVVSRLLELKAAQCEKSKQIFFETLMTSL
jgi:hypothetical protein